MSFFSCDKGPTVVFFFLRIAEAAEAAAAILVCKDTLVVFQSVYTDIVAQYTLEFVIPAILRKRSIGSCKVEIFKSQRLVGFGVKDETNAVRSCCIAQGDVEALKLIEASGVSAEAVATALADAKAAIDEIKTDAQLTAEELAEAKADAKDALDAYKSANDYRDAEKADLAAAIAAGKAAIDAAADTEAVATALANAKTAIDAIKSNAQLTAEELAEAKAKLQDAIDTAKAFFDTIKGNEKCADIADTLDTAIQQGEATLNSDDANEILAKAEQLIAVLASVKEQKDTIDAESADKPSKDTFRCGFCDRYETWKDFPAFGWIVSLVHFFVHTAARIGDFT